MISLNNVSKIFNKKTNNEIKALDGVTFSLEEGKITALIGKTGSGKSTIVNLLLGVIKPSEGTIVISDITINSKTKRKKLVNITKILLSSFQYPDHQLFRTTSREEILFNSDDTEYMDVLIKKLNFDRSLLEMSPYKLSSGQKRKLILISLLVQKPKIILLDEATSFLDPRTRREFIALIKEINIELGTTIFFISHNMEDVKNISDKTIVIEAGKIKDQGPTKAIIKKFIRGDYNE